MLPSTAYIDVVSVFVPVAIVVVVVGGEGAIVVIVGTIIVPVVSVDVEPFVGTLPGRVGATVSPEPQADTLLRRKRISGLSDLSRRLQRERSTAATSPQSLPWWRRLSAASCALSIGEEGSIGVDDYLFR